MASAAEDDDVPPPMADDLTVADVHPAPPPAAKRRSLLGSIFGSKSADATAKGAASSPPRRDSAAAAISPVPSFDTVAVDGKHAAAADTSVDTGETMQPQPAKVDSSGSGEPRPQATAGDDSALGRSSSRSGSRPPPVETPHGVDGESSGTAAHDVPPPSSDPADFAQAPPVAPVAASSTALDVPPPASEPAAVAQAPPVTVEELVHVNASLEHHVDVLQRQVAVLQAQVAAQEAVAATPTADAATATDPPTGPDPAEIAKAMVLLRHDNQCLEDENRALRDLFDALLAERNTAKQDAAAAVTENHDLRGQLSALREASAEAVSRKALEIEALFTGVFKRKDNEIAALKERLMLLEETFEQLAYVGPSSSGAGLPSLYRDAALAGLLERLQPPPSEKVTPRDDPDAAPRRSGESDGREHQAPIVDSTSEKVFLEWAGAPGREPPQTAAPAPLRSSSVDLRQRIRDDV